MVKTVPPFGSKFFVITIWNKNSDLFVIHQNALLKNVQQYLAKFLKEYAFKVSLWPWEVPEPKNACKCRCPFQAWALPRVILVSIVIPNSNLKKKGMVYYRKKS